MSAAQILRELARRGHTIGVDGNNLLVKPPMSAALTQRVKARKLDVIAYLRELGAPPATAHRFTAMSTADLEDVRALGVCIGCGCPWALHGEPPISAWRLVSDPDTVALVDAAAIVAGAAAETLSSEYRRQDAS